MNKKSIKTKIYWLNKNKNYYQQNKNWLRNNSNINNGHQNTNILLNKPNLTLASSTTNLNSIKIDQLYYLVNSYK